MRLADPAARPGSVGLRDVARAAGVSTATVSRAINRPEMVSEPLRTRIAAVIDDLGWIPDAAAKALTTRRSDVIGAVFPTLSHGDFARAAAALQDALFDAGYTLLLAVSDYDPAQELRQVQKFVERGVDGVVLVGACHDPGVAAALARRQLPWIETFVYEPSRHGTAIGPDNARALREMTGHLVALGHRRIGAIWQSLDNNDRARARLDGVRSVIAAHGLPPLTLRVSAEAAGVAEARRLFRDLMTGRPAPTAVICGNAWHALGAGFEALAMGLHVPAEVSIAGYDDIEMLSQMPVPITTVRVSGELIGRRAAECLLARLKGRRWEGDYECPAKLILRASTGPAPEPDVRAGQTADQPR